jgi:hypothetical protein
VAVCAQPLIGRFRFLQSTRRWTTLWHISAVGYRYKTMTNTKLIADIAVAIPAASWCLSRRL